MREYSLFIDGAWTGALAGERITRRRPGTDEAVASYSRGTSADIDAAVAAAQRSLRRGPWRDLALAERSRILFRVADALYEARAELARVEAAETGKPAGDAEADIQRGVDLWRFAAGALLCIHGESHAPEPDVHALTLLEPVGVVGLILPWNFPFVVCAERLPFMLAAGCTVVCKPSEHAAGSTLGAAELAARAGLPAGVLNVVTGYGAEAGVPLVEHRDVGMISFTGSTANGKAVMALASRTLKRLSLELGGKSPIVVFADANLEAAAEAVVEGFTHNAGQCCTATTRLLVERPAAGKLEALLVARLAEAPRQAAATEAQFEKVCGYVAEGRRAGRLVAGGDFAGGVVSPTVFADLPSDSPVCTEEIFGPVLTFDVFDTEAEAIQMANQTDYGLAGAIWTADSSRAIRVARALRAGRLWVNSRQRDYPQLPIGGYGQSGLGREAGAAGIRTYSETKTVIIR